MARDFDDRVAIVLAVAASVGAAGLSFLVLRLIRRSFRVATPVLLSAAIGLAAAVPVHSAWDDGCNVREGWGPLVSWPFVELLRPSRLYPGYVYSETLALCLDR